MNINVGIVAHLNRLPAAENLANQTCARYLAYDDGTLGAEANHRRVWQWHTEHEADWCVTLEDDAVPVPDFTTQVEQALTTAPTPIVSLYLGRMRPPHWQLRVQQAIQEAHRDKAPWITGTHMLHGVAVAIRYHLVQSLVEHRTLLPWDQHITHWAHTHDLGLISYTNPSLVDHADGPTLVADHKDGKGRRPGRIAWEVGTRTEWTSKTVVM